MIAYRWGKLISVTGTFRLEGDVAYNEELFRINGFSLVASLLNGEQLVLINGSENQIELRWNTTNQAQNDWKQFTVFGFLI